MNDHHRIPQQFGNHDVIRYLKQHFNFDMDDADNILRLPSTSKAAQAAGAALSTPDANHVGSHPLYSKVVREFLDQLGKDYFDQDGALKSDKSGQGLLDEIRSGELFGLVDRLIALADAVNRFSKISRGLDPDDPLLLVLDGDGIETIALDSAGIRFDHNDNWFAEETGWLKGDDGFLVIDENGNGRIDGREMLTLKWGIIPLSTNHQSGQSPIYNPVTLGQCAGRLAIGGQTISTLPP